jgi:hypothetical protein
MQSLIVSRRPPLPVIISITYLLVFLGTAIYYILFK